MASPPKIWQLFLATARTYNQYIDKWLACKLVWLCKTIGFYANSPYNFW